MDQQEKRTGEDLESPMGLSGNADLRPWALCPQWLLSRVP